MRTRANGWWFWFMISLSIHAAVVGAGIGWMRSTRTGDSTGVSPAVLVIVEDSADRSEPDVLAAPRDNGAVATAELPVKPKMIAVAESKQVEPKPEITQLKYAPSENRIESRPSAVAVEPLSGTSAKGGASSDLIPLRAEAAERSDEDGQIAQRGAIHSRQDVLALVYEKNPPPAYPSRARTAREEGLVIIGVLVNARGCVEHAQVKESSGHSLLDDAALRAVQGWRFRSKEGIMSATSTYVEIPIRFQLN